MSRITMLAFNINFVLWQCGLATTNSNVSQQKNVLGAEDKRQYKRLPKQPL